MSRHPKTAVFTPALLRAAAISALHKLSPAAQWRNPVMFVVWLGSLLCTLLGLAACFGWGEGAPGFTLTIAAWLWLTVLFANFAEALAEGRGKAQAAALRGVRQQMQARKLQAPKRAASHSMVDAASLRKGDWVLVQAGDLIPADATVIEGVASVDESAITGESAPVIRESGGDFNAVTGGSRLLSDWLILEVSSNPGEAFLDRMIAMVEGARRQKTPNEIALTILLVALSLVFLLVCVCLLPFSLYAVASHGSGQAVSVTVLLALLVCLIPTTIGGLLSAIGVAGMSRMMQANVIASSGRAVEAAGDVDVLLLDKTGTITYGNRQASAFLPVPGVTPATLAAAAQLASLGDDTPEGRSIVQLAQQQGSAAQATPDMVLIPFSAHTRMSGVDLGVRQVRKGATSAIKTHLAQLGGHFPPVLEHLADQVASRGGTPLAVCDGAQALGVVELKDVVKSGMRERFAALRQMGIRTVMVTGDNRLTAASIAAEAGLDDFLAEARPEDKLALIRREQSAGRLVAMTGDGTNDAPALAQADVAVAMNTGAQAAKEAANMVDLDSDPTKLIEVVETGKQMLMTRGALTTFSVANDVAKYFAIIPAAFAGVYPQLKQLDVMQLHSSSSAILSAVIFNALIILFLLPLALRGVRYRALGADALLKRNLLIYGVGGLLLPFPCIKLIDFCLAASGWF